jgi:hypothetical protein
VSAEDTSGTPEAKPELPTALYVCTGKAETTDGKAALVLRELCEGGKLADERLFTAKDLHCRVGHVYRIRISETKGADSIYPSTARWISLYENEAQVAAWQAAARAFDVEKAARRRQKQAEETQQMLEVLKPLRKIYQQTNALGAVIGLPAASTRTQGRRLRPGVSRHANTSISRTASSSEVTAMSTVSNAVNGGAPPSPLPETPATPPVQQLPREELDKILRALEIPFDPILVQWRIMEWSDDGTRGLMMPYADPRAYSDRLNTLFTPAGWTRKYSVQASAPVQRNKRGPAAKILVTCEVTIFCIGANSGTGEDWSDRENSLTAAEAQAFKRCLSCFGLGRYLYDMDGEWVELDQQGQPKRTPRLPRWATPKGWMAGLRPKPRKKRRASSHSNEHGGNGGLPTHAPNGNGQSLVADIAAMESKIGKRMYHGLLKRTANAWSPEQIRELAVQQRVLAQMQAAERGLARLETARARLTPEVAQKVIVSLNAPPAKLEDLQSLHSLVVALEKEVELTQMQN